MPETVVDDPLLHLIEWHSSGREGRGRSATGGPSLAHEDVFDSVLHEWHIRRSEHSDT